VILGVMSIGALLDRPAGRLRLGSFGVSAGIGLAMWAAIVDGAARPASVLASVGCFAVVIALVFTERPAAVETRTALLVCAIAAGAAVVSARVGGVSSSVPRAAATVVLVVAVSFVGVRLVCVRGRAITTPSGSARRGTSMGRTSTPRSRGEVSPQGGHPPSD